MQFGVLNFEASMIKQVVNLSWKSFVRSPAFSQNLGTTIIMGLFGLYFAFIFLAMGAAIPFAFSDSEEIIEAPNLVGGFYLYGLLYILIMRVVFQNFGFPLFKQYALQRIRKSSIYHYVLIRSIWHWMNVIPMLAIMAYLIASNYSEAFQLNIFINGVVMIGMLYLTNYLAFLIDKYLDINKKIVGSVLIVLLVLTFLDAKGYIALLPIFKQTYAWLTSSIVIALLPLLLSIVAYFFSFRFLKDKAYLEDQTEVTTADMLGVRKGLFSRFGKVGTLMELELKLIMRNKRSKSQMTMMCLFMFYPLLFKGESISLLLFVSIFITGAFALTYGQLLLSWNSDHFDLLLTRMSSLKEIFTAKYYLQVISIALSALITILYGFYRFEFFYLIPIAALFNIGVVTFIYMLMASYNSKKIDISKGATMNYEGLSVGLFLIVIPIFIIPIGIMLLANYFDVYEIGLSVIALLGLLGFAFRERLIDVCVHLFKKNRYKIGAAFRK